MPGEDDTLFSFKDPRAPQWAMLILGLALLAGGALVGLILVIEGYNKPFSTDLLAGAGFVAFLLMSGFFITLYGLRDLVSSPIWQVTSTHAIRRRGSRVIRRVPLADTPRPKLMRVVRYGMLISVRVTMGKLTIVAPNMDVAQAIVGVWQKAQGG